MTAPPNCENCYAEPCPCTRRHTKRFKGHRSLIVDGVAHLIVRRRERGILRLCQLG